VSKYSKGGAKGKVKTVRKVIKGSSAELPVNRADSNAQGDKQAMVIFYGLLAMAAVLVVTALSFIIQNLIQAASRSPYDWMSVIGFSLLFAISLLIGRGLIWLSFFGAIMYAMRVKAWQTQENLCRTVMKYHRLIPGGASTSGLMLVQSLIGRGEAEEAIKVGDEQWNRLSTKGKEDQNLAPMCSMLGLAHQLRGDFKESIVWSDRAVHLFQKLLEQVKNPKGMTKLAVMQSPNLAANMQMQLAVAYFNSATSHFNTMNYRAAKENYKKANEHATQAPDSVEKTEILKVSREQMARLKHN